MSIIMDLSTAEWSHEERPHVAFHELPTEMFHDSSSSQTSVSSLSTFVGMFPSRKQGFHYHRLGFHGRRDESNLVMTALERTFASNQSEFVLIQGCSGSGKSALVESLKEHMLTRGAYAVSGKFDQMRNEEPFSAIVAAFTDLVDILRTIQNKMGGESMFVNEPRGMSDILESDDAKLLRNLISNLYMREGRMNDAAGSGLQTALHSSLDRLTTCCCNFLRTVASPNNPVVLHLDDIQWADESSLALLEALIRDPNSRNLLVVCTCRNDESMSGNPHAMRFLKTEFKMKATKIQLGNLGLPSVNKMISELLDIDESLSLSLAEVVQTKTMGNPFFVLSYLESLQAEGLLQRSSSLKWGWDLNKIQSETMVASNVADLVTAKIQRLNVDLQLVLKSAACLGFEFDRSLLDLFVMANDEFTHESISNHLDTEFCKNKITKLLAEAVDEGLIQMLSADKYKFVHDRISQCLYDIIPQGKEKEAMHLKIGCLVWEMAQSKPEPQDWMVFSAVTHFNKCRHSVLCGDICKVRVARINLEAAFLSLKKAAIEAAAAFCETGLSLLAGPQLWNEHYSVSLPLTTMLAELKFLKGEIPDSKQLSKDVLDNTRSLSDKMKAYYTMIDCLGAEGQLQKAMDLGFSVLRILGERFPKQAGIGHVVWELGRTKRLLRGKTDKMLLNLPIVTDETKLARLRVASLISTYAPFLGEEKQILVLFLRITQMCVRDGNSWLAPTAYSMYGMIEAGMGNASSAYRFGRLCIKLTDKIGRQQCGGIPHSISRAGLMHWNEPVRRSLEPLNDVLEMSIASGQSKDAFFCLQVYIASAWHCGETLDKLEERMRNCCEQKQQVNFVQENTALLLMLVRPMWQGVLNLQGNVADPSRLCGEAVHSDDFMEKATKSGNWGAMMQFRHVQLTLAYMFGEYDEALISLKQLAKRERAFSFHFVLYNYFLYGGLTYLALAERTGERIYKAKAKRFLKRLEKLKNVNSLPVLQLLRAAFFALKMPDSELSQIRYDEAVASARRAQLPNLEALANELAWQASNKKNEPRKEYLARAIQLYSQWGAKAKVDQLEQYNHSVPATEATTKRSRRVRSPQNFLVDTSGAMCGPVWAG